MNRKRPLLGVCFLLLIAFGCASRIPGEVRSQVTYQGPFPDLQQNPRRYLGEVVMLGGEIVETIPSASSSEIVVVQLPLKGSGRPDRERQTEGRFLVRTPRFLDPAVYSKGDLITVVGRVSGGEVRPVGSHDYVYPLLDAIHLRLWPDPVRSRSPSIHFGVGVGTTF